MQTNWDYFLREYGKSVWLKHKRFSIRSLTPFQNVARFQLTVYLFNQIFYKENYMITNNWFDEKYFIVAYCRNLFVWEDWKIYQHTED